MLYICKRVFQRWTDSRGSEHFCISSLSEITSISKNVKQIGEESAEMWTLCLSLVVKRTKPNCKPVVLFSKIHLRLWNVVSEQKNGVTDKNWRNELSSKSGWCNTEEQSESKSPSHLKGTIIIWESGQDDSLMVDVSDTVETRTSNAR